MGQTNLVDTSSVDIEEAMIDLEAISSLNRLFIFQKTNIWKTYFILVLNKNIVR